MDLNGSLPGIPEAHVHCVADLPEHLEGAVPAGGYTRAKPGELLIAFPGIGRFRVRGGTTIEVAPEPNADPGMVALVLHGRARGALIHQRGELPLHAASLVPKGHNNAVAVCGASGTGKSTLAAELSRRGWILMADDTTRVTSSEPGALAWPSRDRIKLWGDACDAAGLDVLDLEQVTNKSNKYYVRVPARVEPARLIWVFELTRDETAEMELTGTSEKMAVLTSHACRPVQIRPLGCAGQHIRIVAKVAQSCRMVRLTGARERPVSILADAVEKFVL